MTAISVEGNSQEATEKKLFTNPEYRLSLNGYLARSRRIAPARTRDCTLESTFFSTFFITFCMSTFFSTFFITFFMSTFFITFFIRALFLALFLLTSTFFGRSNGLLGFIDTMVGFLHRALPS